MILFIGIHSIRTYLTGSYKFPREANWLTGSILMMLTLGMGFTGQLLVWDQNALWSTVVAAEQASKLPIIGKLLGHWTLAGNTVGGATLSRFYAAHVFFFPGLIFAMLGAHLYLVVHHGISEPPKAGRQVDPKTYRAWYQNLLKREGRPFWPDAAWRDVTFGFLMIVVLFLLAWFVGPPELSKAPDPTIVKAAPHPYWYFIWYLAVLARAPHAGEKFIIIAVPLVFFLVMFVLPFVANKGERSPLRRPWSMGLVLLSVIIIGVFWREGTQQPWVPDFEAQPLPEKVIGVNSGPIHNGAALFHEKGCEFCHDVSGYGGRRGPDLTDIGDRLTSEQMIIRIMNGGYNMPAYAGILKSQETDDIIAFLKSRTIAGGAHPNEPAK
jgi:ubiquinol-cytochrome c reductase cytochrome b subunit